MSEKKGDFNLFRKKEEEDLKKEKAQGGELDEKRRQAARDKTNAEIRERHEERMEAAKAKREEEAKKELKVHVVERGDTLTAIALKYYGNAGEFMKIYEANKDVIGDNPDRILVGMELVIPEL